MAASTGGRRLVLRQMRLLAGNLRADLPAPKPWQLLAGHALLMAEVAGGRRCKMCAQWGLSTMPESFQGCDYGQSAAGRFLRRMRFHSGIRQGPLIGLNDRSLGESSTRSLYGSTTAVILCIALLPELKDLADSSR